MKTEKDLGLLGTTVSDGSQCPPSTPDDDEYPPELIAELRKEYDEWFSRRLVWRPIETAPKNERVLIFVLGEHRIGFLKSGGGWNQWQLIPGKYGVANGHTPTHWMPLPAPPSDEATDSATSKG